MKILANMNVFSQNASRIVTALRSLGKTILLLTCSCIALTAYAQDQCFSINITTISGTVNDGANLASYATIRGGECKFVTSSSSATINDNGIRLGDNNSWLEVTLGNKAALQNGTKITAKVWVDNTEKVGGVRIKGVQEDGSDIDICNAWTSDPLMGKMQMTVEGTVTCDVSQKYTKFRILRGNSASGYVKELTITGCGIQCDEATPILTASDVLLSNGCGEVTFTVTGFETGDRGTELNIYRVGDDEPIATARGVTDNIYTFQNIPISITGEYYVEATYECAVTSDAVYIQVVGPLLTPSKEAVCSSGEMVTFTVSNFQAGSILTLYRVNEAGTRTWLTSSNSEVTADSYTFTDNIAITASNRYEVTAEADGCTLYSERVWVRIVSGMKTVKYAKELTYMPDALRQKTMRMYVGDRHRMPLVKIISCTKPEYKVSLSLKRKGASTTESFTLQNTEWVVPYASTDSSLTLLADFAVLRDVIIKSGYSIVLSDEASGVAVSDEASSVAVDQSLYVGDVINVTLTITASGSDVLTETVPIRISDKYHIGYIVRGNIFGDFYEVCDTGTKNKYTTENFKADDFPDLYDGVLEMLRENGFEVTPVNAWAEFDTLNYRPFDLLFLTDYPTVGNVLEVEVDPKSNPKNDHPYFVNRMFELVGQKPIFTWKGYLASPALPAWSHFGFKGQPFQPNWTYWQNEGGSWEDLNSRGEQILEDLKTMYVFCDHSIFRKLDTGDKETETGNFTLKILDNLSNPNPDAATKTHVGLQGFDELAEGFVPIAYLVLPKTSGPTPWASDTLYTSLEWQGVTRARFLLFSVFKEATPYLSDNGKGVVISAINYLLDANPAHVEDCAYIFDNGYDYFYVDALGTTPEQLLEEYGDIEIFEIRDSKTDALLEYRIRYEREDYKAKFDEWKKKAIDNEDESEYPFEMHDNNWRNTANWIQNNLPSANHNVRLRSPAILDYATYEVKDLRINNRVSKLTIEPTGGLKVSGNIEQYDGMEDYTTRFPIDDTDTLLYIKSSKDFTGMLAHIHDDKTPRHTNKNGSPRPYVVRGTVELYSTAHYSWEGETDDHKGNPVYAYKWWTYFGMPVKEAPIPERFFMAYTYKWREDLNNWERMGDGTNLNEQWAGYGLSQEKTETFLLPGELWESGSQEIKLTYNTTGANIIGYPWTAPLCIDSMTDSDFKNAYAEIFIYNTGRDPGWWGEDGKNTHDRPDNGNMYEGNNHLQEGRWFGIPVNITSSPEYIGPRYIPAMQGFMVRVMEKGKDASVRLDYKHMVYDHIKGDETKSPKAKEEQVVKDAGYNTPRYAPRRDDDDQDEAPRLMRITLSNGDTRQDAYLVEGKDFTDAFDNGWESHYTGGGNKAYDLWVYSSTLGKLSCIALPSLDGCQLGYIPSVDTTYTFTFAWDGDLLYLNDAKERQSTPIAAGYSYRFEASKTDDSNRFFISSVPYHVQMPTGVEDLIMDDGTLRLNNPSGEMLTVSVYDAAGRLCVSYRTSEALSEVPLPVAAQGVYMVSVHGEQTSFARKVIR